MSNKWIKWVFLMTSPKPKGTAKRAYKGHSSLSASGSLIWHSKCS